MGHEEIRALFFIYSSILGSKQTGAGSDRRSIISGFSALDVAVM